MTQKKHKTIRKKNKNILIAITIIVVAIFAVAIVKQTFFQETKIFQKEQILEKVTINQVGDFVLYLPLYVAKEAGFFAQRGIDATIVSSGGDDKSFAAVLSGRAQFAQGDPTFVAISREKGGPGKVVATIINKAPFWLVSNKNITINSPKDFQGKKLVTYLSPSTAYTLTTKLGLDSGLKEGENYTIIESQFGAELGPLFLGKADASLTLPPVVQEAEKQGAKRIFSYPKEFGNMSVTGLTTTDEFILNHPDTVNNVVLAYQDALDFIFTHPNKASDIAAKRFPSLSKRSIDEAIQLMIKEKVWPRTTATSKESWNKAIQVRVQVGDIKNPPSYLESIDNSFSQQ